MDLVTAFLVGLLGVPVLSVMVAVIQERNWTPPPAHESGDTADSIYTTHEAYNRYENQNYKEM